jgi:aminopeptidase-like protein
MAAQVQELDRDEMEQILHQIPEKADREDYIRTYFGMK